MATSDLAYLAIICIALVQLCVAGVGENTSLQPQHPPDGFVVSRTLTRVQWQRCEGTGEYRVELAIDKPEFSHIALSKKTQKTHTNIHGLKPGHRYYWRVVRDGFKSAVVDFYVSRKFPAEGEVRHGWFTRNFWPLWFGNDNVFPSPDHVPYLKRHFHTRIFSEHRAKVPYLPLVRVPYYNFIGSPKHREP